MGQKIRRPLERERGDILNAEKAIADYLEEKGITQAHVARKCGFTKQKMYKIVKQKQKLGIEDYMKICIALDVHPNFFFDKAREEERK